MVNINNTITKLLITILYIRKKRKVRFTMLRLSTRHEFHINPSISDKHYDYGFSCNTTKYEINKLVLKE